MIKKESIKLKNNKYLDTSSIVHNKNNLKEKLLLPHTLYENFSGTTGSITLNDSVANDQYIDVVRGANGTFTTQRIYNANNKKTGIRVNYLMITTYIDLLSVYGIENNRITPILSECGYINITNVSTANFVYDKTNYFNIIKVVGYK